MLKQLFLSLAIAAAARDANPVSSEDMLRRTSAAAESLWDRISAVNCVELVDQQKLGGNGKIVYRQQSEFDYLAVLQLAANDLMVDESRQALHGPGNSKPLPLLITNGFSVFAFIFHPFYRGGFEFSTPQPVLVDNQALLEVRFRGVHGARSPSVLKLRNRDYPLEWQGTAWIEPESGAVVRVSAGLGNNMEDLGLKSLHADVRYSPVDFKDESGIYWLPAAATVEVETARQHWRNVHTFTRYRRFSVDVKSGVEAPR
jgi:hypothetical protein